MLDYAVLDAAASVAATIEGAQGSFDNGNLSNTVLQPAQVAIAIVILVGPVFIPWLLFERLSFLFWGWFRTLMV